MAEPISLPPQGPTGLAVLCDPLVLKWCLGLTVLHIVVRLLVVSFSSSRDKPTMLHLGTKPGLVAHQLAIFIPFTFAAVYGTASYLTDEEIAALGGGDHLDRLYGRTEVGWMIMRFMVGKRRRFGSTKS